MTPGRLGRTGTRPGRPICFSVKPDNSLTFDCVPDAAYTISGEYYSTPVEDEADAQSPVFPAQFHLAIVFRAMMYAGGISGRPIGRTLRAARKRHFGPLRVQKALCRKATPCVRRSCSTRRPASAGGDQLQIRAAVENGAHAQHHPGRRQVVSQCGRRCRATDRALGRRRRRPRWNGCRRKASFSTAHGRTCAPVFRSPPIAASSAGMSCALDARPPASVFRAAASTSSIASTVAARPYGSSAAVSTATIRCSPAQPAGATVCGTLVTEAYELPVRAPNCSKSAAELRPSTARATPSPRCRPAHGPLSGQQQRSRAAVVCRSVGDHPPRVRSCRTYPPNLEYTGKLMELTPRETSC